MLCGRGCGQKWGCDVVMSAVLSFVCVGDRRGECPVTGSTML